MSLFDDFIDVVKGATVTVGVVVASPFFGPVGAITAVGVVVAGTVGATVAIIDKVAD